MKDIKKPSRNLRYSTTLTPLSGVSRSSDIKVRSVHVNATGSRAHLSELKHKVEDYENSNDYENAYEDHHDFYNRYDGSHSSKKSNTNIHEIRNHGARTKTKSFSKAKMRILMLCLAVFGALMLYTFVFNSATITITPKLLDAKVKEVFMFENTDDKKAFEIVKIDRTVEKVIARSEKQKVSSKASGDITIYNNFNENSQKLIKNTRFESKEGKIFRISDTVVVPGKVGATPGKIKVRVTADSVGDSYNVAAGRFSIPGFKGSARYEGFYATSDSAMSGGADTEKMAVAKDAIDSAINDMTIEAKESIKTDMLKLEKENFISLSNDISYKVTTNINDFESGKDDKFRVFVTGNMIMLSKSSLASTLIKKADANYKQEEVIIKNPQDLRFKTENATSTDLGVAKSIRVYIEGLPTFIYKTDASALKADLAGKDNSDSTFSSILSKYTTISNAKSKMSPFWSSSYPKNINKINVVQ